MFVTFTTAKISLLRIGKWNNHISQLTLNQMKKILIPLGLALVCFLSFNSCDDQQPNQPFVAIMDVKTDNREALQKASQIITTAMTVNKDKAALNLGVVEVRLDTQLTKLFDTKNHPCGDLPGKVLKKLDKRSWMPKSLEGQMTRLPAVASYLMGESVSVLLHSVQIQKSDGTKLSPIVVYGAPTFENLDLEAYMATQYDSYAYSLDCSGYLSAALEASGANPAGDITAKASSALKNSGSLMLAFGSIYSPFLAALRPKIYGKNMPDSTRLAVLTALEARLLGIEETATIDLSERYVVLWASKKGQAGFNGEASFKANVGGNLGIAKLSANANTGGTLSRKSSFTNFDTYLLNSVKLTDVEPVTVKEVKALVKELTPKNKETKSTLAQQTQKQND